MVVDNQLNSNSYHHVITTILQFSVHVLEHDQDDPLPTLQPEILVPLLQFIFNVFLQLLHFTYIRHDAMSSGLVNNSFEKTKIQPNRFRPISRPIRRLFPWEHIYLALG